MTDGTRIWDQRWAPFAVVAITCLVFAPTLVFGFIDYDDRWLWSLESPLRDFDLHTLHRVFFQIDDRRPLGSEYLPVRDVFVALDMAIWGESERGPHLTQLPLYALSIYGLGRLLVRFGLPRPIAWLATLLWAIHPLHVESVAWVSERKGILAGLFVIACGHAWLRYREGRHWVWLVAAAVAAVAGVWSKAPALFGPAAIAMLDLVFLARSRRRWVAIALIGGAALAASVPVVIVASDKKVIDEAYSDRRPHRVASMLAVNGHYLQGLVLAKAPSLSYPISTDGPAPIDYVMGVVVVAGSVAAVRRRWRRAAPEASDDGAYKVRVAAIGWAWVWMLPVCHLIVPVHLFAADRYVYWWILGGCLLAAQVVERLPRTLQLAASGALVCILAVGALRAQEAWTNSLELFARAYANNPHDTGMCDGYAKALGTERQFVEAIAVLDACLKRHPRNSDLMVTKSRALGNAGRRREALEVSAQAAETNVPTAMASHGELLRIFGRPAEALPWITRAAERKPTEELYARWQGELLFQLGRYAEAEPVLRRAIALRSEPRVTHLWLAHTLVRLGRAVEAEEILTIATRDPALHPGIAIIRAEIAARP